MNNRYSVITFDMGLTLVTLEPFAEMFFRVGQRLGLQANLGALEKATDEVWKQVMEEDATTRYEPTTESSRRWWRDVNLRTLRAAGVPPVYWDAMDAGFMALLDNPAEYSIFPDVRTTLTALRAHGFRLGVISNWNSDLPDMCRAWGIAPFFDFILASWAVGYAKPNPRIFQEAVLRAGADAGNMLHVGDNYVADVLGARTTGIDAIWLNRQRRATPQDCAAISSLEELLPLLNLPPSHSERAG